MNNIYIKHYKKEEDRTIKEDKTIYRIGSQIRIKPLYKASAENIAIQTVPHQTRNTGHRRNANSISKLFPRLSVSISSVRKIPG